MSHRRSIWKHLGKLAAWAGLALLHGWALLALYFWFSGHHGLAAGVVLGYGAVLALLFFMAQTQSHAAGVSLVLWLAVAVWWARRGPEPGLSYPRETEQAAKLTVEGSFLTVHGMRDFRYRSATEFEARWSSRTFDLNQLEHVDFFFNYWGIPDVAHVTTSFVFKDEAPLAVSIELRAESREPETLLRGFFKQYELFYLWADERDTIQRRTSHLQEEVYLFRSNLTPQQGRRLLLAMAQRSNNLEENPEFYNTLTDNCTNVIARHVDEVMGRQVPWYRRPLLSGKYERLGYEQGWLLHSLPWQQHRAAALINDRARQAGDGPGFYGLIRTHLPVSGAPVQEQYPEQ
jgi:hypothetical protein